MTTYTWKIANYFRAPNPIDGLEGVITKIGWTVDGERDGEVARRMGVTELDPADPESFLIWDDVTDAQALEWVRDRLAVEPGFLADQSLLDYWLSQIENELDTRKPPEVISGPKTPDAGDGE